MSTTGFATQNYLEWIPLAQIILFFLMFIGGSSGSTSGGVKVIRWVILAKQATNESLKMLHPHGIFSIRLNGRAGRNDVVYNVSAFFFPLNIINSFNSFLKIKYCFYFFKIRIPIKAKPHN